MLRNAKLGGASLGRFSVLFFGAAVVAALTAVPARAQDQSQKDDRQQSAQPNMGKPSPILVIWREDVKVGHNATHEKVEQGYAQLFARMPGARNFIGMKSISGPPEWWFAEPASSLMDLQKEREEGERATPSLKTQMDQLDARESNEVSAARGVTLMYREDLSLNPKFDLPHSRFLRVSIYRVRPGHEDEFAEAAKTVAATYQKAKLDDMQWATYRAFSGDMAGTYYVFRPVDTLEKLDPTANANDMKAFDQALGKDNEQKLNKMMADGVLSVESNIFAFDPKISYPPAAFAAADSFWSTSAGQMAQVGTSGKSSNVKTAKRKKQ